MASHLSNPIPIATPIAGSLVDSYDKERGHELEHGAQTLADLHTLLLKRSKPSDYTRLIKQARIFTFVIDPIERFLLAMNECVLRRVAPHSLDWKSTHDEYMSASQQSLQSDNHIKKSMKKYQKYIKSHQVTTHDVREILHAVLTGDEDMLDAHLLPLPSVNHFYLMSNLLKEFQPDYVGDYTQFLEEWRSVERLYSVTLPLRYGPDHSKYEHSGRIDTLGVIRTMRSLLESEPLYMKALCKLYLRDYICFDIPLPVSCGAREDNGYTVGRRTFFPRVEQESSKGVV